MSSDTGWQACRMNGIGVFASRNLTRHFFVEGALATYFTDNEATVLASQDSGYDTPIDRVSGLLSVAAGARDSRDPLGECKACVGPHASDDANRGGSV